MTIYEDICVFGLVIGLLLAMTGWLLFGQEEEVDQHEE